MKIEIVEDVKERLKMDNKYVKGLLKGKVKIERKRAEKTIIMTTHYLEEAEALSDRMGIIKKGRMVEIGTLKAIKNRYPKFQTMTSETEWPDVSLVQGHKG